MHTNNFSSHLQNRQLLSTEQLSKFEQSAKNNNRHLLQELLCSSDVDKYKLAILAAEYFKLEFLELDDKSAIKLPTHLLKNELIKQHKILPIALNKNILTIAVADPTKTQIFNEIKFHTNLQLELVVAECSKLESIISKISDSNFEIDKEQDDYAVKFIDNILTQASAHNASDIHLETYKDSYRIRIRVDGILQTLATPEPSLATRFAARLKIMANLDISERRLPQDGRFSIKLGTKTHECRLSTCPTLYGEKIVVRLLNQNNLEISIESLGLEPEQLQIFTAALNKAQGLILVTGPTGSGKTSTLYTALNLINSADKNISTVEDPVEVNIPGINQVNIQPKIGLNFATVLRSFLRQDPDIIMIGEIRDPETAEIAIKAAQTGHLVLATLHTNSAIASINRLLNMGVKPYNLGSAVTLLIGQRLVRRQAADGYKGRIGIFELVPISAQLGHMIAQHSTNEEIIKQAQQEGLRDLSTIGLAKVTSGVTTMEELQRVL